MIYRNIVKRSIDIVFSLLVIIVLWPLFIVVAVLIKLESPGPVFFRQKRIGKDGKVFEMLKFRSMYDEVEYTGSGVYSDDSDERVTKIGKILRATSIDELPQAFNILEGDMSLIGPRPPLTYHPWKFEEYTKEEKRMFEVRPGITGWAQVHGRKQVEWHERIRLNVWYIDNLTFLLDLKIFFMTFYKVIKNSDNTNTEKTA